MKLKVLYESSLTDVQTILNVLYEYLSEEGPGPPLYPAKKDTSTQEINQEITTFGKASISICSPEDWHIASLTVWPKSPIVGAYDPSIGNEKFDLSDPDSLEKIRDFCYRSYSKKKKRSYGRTKIPRGS